FETDRGGDVTFHGPGQLVGYPIFDLHGYPSSAKSALKYLGAVDYVRRVEEVLIRSCLEYGIPTKRIKGLTGVWTDWSGAPVEGDRHPSQAHLPVESGRRSEEDAKIAAIGVHISRSVTSHGFALNVNTDLDYFKLIVPCGISDKSVTSIAHELDREVDLDEVAQCVSRNFGRVFERQMLAVDTVDELLGRAVGVPNRVPGKIRNIQGDTDALA
ncbi:MAG: lipoyl(octanoyl) transferase LipB, partial [Terriglobales bacterium]